LKNLAHLAERKGASTQQSRQRFQGEKRAKRLRAPPNGRLRFKRDSPGSPRIIKKEETGKACQLLRLFLSILTISDHKRYVVRPKKEGVQSIGEGRDLVLVGRGGCGPTAQSNESSKSGQPPRQRVGKDQSLNFSEGGVIQPETRRANFD